MSVKTLPDGSKYTLESSMHCIRKAKRLGLCSKALLNRPQPFVRCGDFLQPADRPLAILQGRLLLAASRRNEEPARWCPRANKQPPTLARRPLRASSSRLQAILQRDRKSTRLNSSHVKISYA